MKVSIVMNVLLTGDDRWIPWKHRPSKCSITSIITQKLSAITTHNPPPAPRPSPSNHPPESAHPNHATPTKQNGQPRRRPRKHRRYPSQRRRQAATAAIRHQRRAKSAHPILYVLLSLLSTSHICTTTLHHPIPCSPPTLQHSEHC